MAFSAPGLAGLRMPEMLQNVDFGPALARLPLGLARSQVANDGQLDLLSANHARPLLTR
jgi:hypothetical protein